MFILSGDCVDTMSGLGHAQAIPFHTMKSLRESVPGIVYIRPLEKLVIQIILQSELMASSVEMFQITLGSISFTL